MARFRATVIIECETVEEASAVMESRLNFNKDVTVPRPSDGRLHTYKISFWGIEPDPVPEG